MSRYATIAGKVRHISGWRPDLPDPRDRIAGPELANAQIPAAHDLRPLCPPVRDQGRLGSCTANASLEAMGFLYTKAGKKDPNLSRLFCYYFSREDEGTPPDEDSGCQIRDVVKTLAKRGCCLESEWPYVDDGAAFAETPSMDAIEQAMEHQIRLYIRLPSLRTIKASIAAGFPPIGGFSVPDNLMSDACAKTGIVQYPTAAEGFEGGHCVLFVGYDDAVERLTFQNSWSSAWGAKGFGFLPYRFVTDGIATDFWTVRSEEQPL